MGPFTDYKEGQWYIATFNLDPSQGDVDRRTAFVRNNGPLQEGSRQVPSFTIISNRCAHLGCPVQANGPTGQILGLPNQTEHGKNGPVLLQPVVPAGFGCPCHGGQYDTEGNRTAGPPVRALDRYEYSIVNGRLILLSTFSVAHVVGQGAQAQIHKYKPVGPGEHVDGPEQWFYPLNPPHH
jgi:Rieske Fe-S protein